MRHGNSSGLSRMIAADAHFMITKKGDVMRIQNIGFAKIAYLHGLDKPRRRIEGEKMSFTNGKPWIATEKDCDAPWGGSPHGKRFRCYLCGCKFKPGDRVRWQYTNDVPEAGGNPLVCEKCDGTKEEIVAKMKAMREEARGRMWWFCGE
jgi:hypothetical protein